MFRDASIGRKLLYAFSALTLLSFAIGYFGSSNIKRNNVLVDEIISGTTPRIQALLEMRNVSNEIGHSALLIQTTSGVDNARSIIATVTDTKSLILANLERLLHWVDQYRLTIHEATNIDSDVFLDSVDHSKSSIIALTLEYIDTKERGASDEVILAKEVALNTEIEALKDLIAAALASETEGLRIQKENAQRNMERILNATMLMSILSAFFAVAAWSLLSRNIVRPLRALRNAAHSVAGGDMKQVIALDSKDEIGDLAKAFQDMVERIREYNGVLMENNKQLEAAQKELEKRLNETNRVNEHMINRELRMIELKKQITALENAARRNSTDQ